MIALQIVQHIRSSVIGGKAEQMLERMSSIASREWQNYPIALKAMYLSGMVAWSVASSKVVCEGEVLTTDPSDMVKEALQMALADVEQENGALTAQYMAVMPELQAAAAEIDACKGAVEKTATTCEGWRAAHA